MTMNSDIRNGIVKDFEVYLEPKGFGKRSNSLIRQTETGLIQVIDFVLGQNYSITNNHLGLGFGVYTDEWFKHLNFGSKPKNINTSYCELRSDFNGFIPHDNNFGWIDLKQALTETQNQIRLLVDKYFIPQLDNLKTREKIIEQWKFNGNAIGLPPRGRLSIAIIYWYLNKRDLANELIELELLDSKGKPYYDYVLEKQKELNKNTP
jgi:hypothetical protein